MYLATGRLQDSKLDINTYSELCLLQGGGDIAIHQVVLCCTPCTVPPIPVCFSSGFLEELQPIVSIIMYSSLWLRNPVVSRLFLPDIRYF